MTNNSKDQEILEKLKSNWTYQEIAKHCKVGYNTISRIAKENNITKGKGSRTDRDTTTTDTTTTTTRKVKSNVHQEEITTKILTYIDALAGGHRQYEKLGFKSTSEMKAKLIELIYSLRR